MDEQEEKSTTVLKDLEIENMQQFLLENQDIKLENLPRYEDMIAPQPQPETKLKDMQEVNELPFFDTKPKPKEEPKPTYKHKKRFKVAVGCFAMVGVLLSAMALINGVSLALLQKEVTDNNKDIATLTEQVTELQQDIDIDSSLIPDGAEKVRYKLALPRNYPDNTADLTWFDKLSIFLMKLFG